MRGKEFACGILFTLAAQALIVVIAVESYRLGLDDVLARAVEPDRVTLPHVRVESPEPPLDPAAWPDVPPLSGAVGVARDARGEEVGR